MVATAAAEFFERSPQPALIIGAADEVVAANAALRDLYGADPRGQPLRALFRGAGEAALASALAAGGELLGLLCLPGGECCPVRLVLAEAEGGVRYGVVHDRSEQLDYERKLERMGAVARKTTNSVVISDAQGRIEWVNDAFMAQTGYCFEEVRGLRPGPLLNSPLNDAETLRRIGEAFVRSEAIKIELIERRKDGGSNIVEMDAAPVFEADGRLSAWIAIKTNVTQRRETLQRLEEAERRAEERRRELSDALEAMAVGFALFDREDRLVLCNERLRELYAISAPLLFPGQQFEAWVRGAVGAGHSLTAREEGDAWIGTVLQHHSLGGSLEHRLADGRWIRVIERKTPDGGRVGLHIDITALKEHQLALDEAARRAEAANEAKSAFLATMSHEIRTPLNGVIGLADVLGALVQDREQGELVGAIRQSGETLLTILNDILDFSKIEAGQMTLEAIALDPQDVGRRVRQLHEPLAREKGLTLTFRGGEGPARLGDPTRLIQVLNNLVANGIKFTETGGVTVEVTNPAEGPLSITVSDTGIGMEGRDLQRIHERFAQADSSITRRYGGTGLGLSIVNGLVSAMDGRLDVATAAGEGTRVTVTLPLPPLAGAVAAGPVERAAQPLAGLRVLASDDNQTNRTVLARILERLGAQTRMTASGTEALAAAAEAWHDILLLDISMPDMDGIEALALIRKGEREGGRARSPAIAVTANALDHQVEAYLAAGFDGHVAKPLRLASISDACRAAFGGGAKAGRLIFAGG